MKVLVGVRRFDSDRRRAILTLKGAFGVQNAMRFVNELGIAISYPFQMTYFLGGPLPPEDNTTLVCYQELTE